MLKFTGSVPHWPSSPPKENAPSSEPITGPSFFLSASMWKSFFRHSG